ncbi:glycosyltransferase family 4 protein [Marinobacter hydrocarbonoclasticus]|uniref:MraY family glycosyltransferase n=1 Tax=Marinobacter nauticus TaxID=2743 RepID=UPI001C98890F|nr:glycosyltransferase family 4 protein [Marinobacter nauticus]MBY6192905.1 glycosyltransferase family 4 protein [Marinobacter nauticus]MBY6214053.1 glycosyltransferase family 4 protein [Marinobacter nauticus]
MTSISWVLALLGVGVVALATIMTAGVRLWALQKQALVEPSERCAHSVPTPHGGGIAIAATTIMLGVMFSVLDWVPDSSMLAFVALGFTMLALGVWDDFGDVSAKLRLALHFMVVIVGLWSVPRLPTFSLFGFSLDTSALYFLWPVLVVAWVWLINLYNFMDGIDGLAAVQALVLFSGMALNFWFMGFGEWAWISMFMFSAVLGFTILNWPPAKIFMGDGGSGFLGFVIGFLMLLSASQTNVSLWSWIILLTLFISDATVTLVTRTLTGQNPMKAHNLHAYQKLSRRFGKHLPVTLGYGLVMLFVLVPASVVANAIPHSGPALFALVFFAASVGMVVVGAGRKEVAGG